MPDPIAWYETRPVGNTDQEWYSGASDSTGQHLIVGAGSASANKGRLYISSDYGANWAETRPAGDTDQFWTSCSSSADGSILVVATSHLDASVNSGKVYISLDYGATWNDVTPSGVAGFRDWLHTGISSDGSHIIAADTVFGSKVFVSTDYGATWSDKTPTTTNVHNWQLVASDSTGQHLLCGSAINGSYPNSGRLYISNDYGDTWTERQPEGNFSWNWNVATLSSDGSRLVVGYAITGVSTGGLYISSDYGATWVNNNPGGVGHTEEWNCIASSADGLHVIVGANTNFGKIYISTDGGSTWHQTQSSISRNWYVAASDSIGKRLLIGDLDQGGGTGRLYISGAPAVNFSGTPTSGPRSLLVSFTDGSSGTPTSWLWDFGDGNTSTLQNPTHSYINAGVYTVTLTATNAFGSNSFTRTGYITVTDPDVFLQNTFLSMADTNGDVQTVNTGKDDNGTPIYYEVETQELEFGNRLHNKKISDKIVVFAKDGEGSQLQVSENGIEYKPIEIDLSDRVNIGKDINMEGNFFKFKWFGNINNNFPIFEGLYLENIEDKGFSKS